MVPGHGCHLGMKVSIGWRRPTVRARVWGHSFRRPFSWIHKVNLIDWSSFGPHRVCSGRLRGLNFRSTLDSKTWREINIVQRVKGLEELNAFGQRLIKRASNVVNLLPNRFWIVRNTSNTSTDGELSGRRRSNCSSSSGFIRNKLIIISRKSGGRLNSSKWFQNGRIVRELREGTRELNERTRRKNWTRDEREL